MSVRAEYLGRLCSVHVELDRLCGNKCVLQVDAEDGYDGPLSVELPIGDMRFLAPTRQNAEVMITVEVCDG